MNGPEPDSMEVDAGEFAFPEPEPEQPKKLGLKFSWREIAHAVNKVRNQIVIERTLEQKFVKGPFTSSRAMRRASGERGYGHGYGEMTIPKSRRRG